MRKINCDGQNEKTRIDVVYDWRKNSSENVPGYVSIRIYYNRTSRKYINTGVCVLPSEWDSERWVVRREDAVVLNKMINEQLDKCKKVVSEKETVLEETGICEEATTGEMKVDRNDDAFLKWMGERIDRDVMANGTRVHMRVMMRNLIEWGKIRRFEDVKRKDIEEWIDSLRARGIEDVTLYGYWKRLKKWLNVAIREGKLGATCYRGVIVPRGRSKERVFLTDDEMKKMMEVKLESVHLERARDLFLIQMGCGLAFADLMEIDFSRHEMIGGYETLHGRRRKTGEAFFCVLLPWASEKLATMGWEVRKISNAKYNDYVSSVAHIAGIDKHVTSHVARHTYACYCLRHGVKMEAVQRTLGHTDIRTTQIYARLADMDVVDAFGKAVF